MTKIQNKYVLYYSGNFLQNKAKQKGTLCALDKPTIPIINKPRNKIIYVCVKCDDLFVDYYSSPYASFSAFVSFSANFSKFSAVILRSFASINVDSILSCSGS